MSQTLADYLIQAINRIKPPQYQEFLDRVSQGKLTRDENPATHFSTFFVAIDITPDPNTLIGLDFIEQNYF